MAKYIIDGKKYSLSLKELNLKITGRFDGFVRLSVPYEISISELFKCDPDIINEDICCDFKLNLFYAIEKGPRPIVSSMSYDKGYWCGVVEIELTKSERKFLQKLLDEDNILKEWFSLETAKKRVSKDVYKILGKAIPNDYMESILAHFDEETERSVLDAIVDDVIASSDWKIKGEYNDDDVRIAIGRELAAQLGE